MSPPSSHQPLPAPTLPCRSAHPSSPTHSREQNQPQLTQPEQTQLMLWKLGSRSQHTSAESRNPNLCLRRSPCPRLPPSSHQPLPAPTLPCRSAHPLSKRAELQIQPIKAVTRKNACITLLELGNTDRQQAETTITGLTQKSLPHVATFQPSASFGTSPPMS
jgi:hypothetical protein